MGLQVPGQLPSQPPQITPQNGSVSTETTTPPNSTGTPNTPPVVQPKVPKSEFKKLTNEWNETHEKLSANFRELNGIFADIKFLLQKLESQLAAAGIKSEVSNCFEEVQGCLESFSNANAHAAALDTHLKKLDKNVFDKAPQDVQDTLKILREKVTQAGNIGKAIGVPEAAHNASSAQSTPPAAPTGTVTQTTQPAAPTGTVTQTTPPAAPTGTVTQTTQPAAPTGTVTQTNQPVLSFNATIRAGHELLEKIDENRGKIETASNSLNKKISALKASRTELEKESSSLKSELTNVYQLWEAKHKLFAAEKIKKELATRSGIPFTPSEQTQYDAARKDLQSNTVASLAAIKNINEKLAKIDRECKGMLARADSLKSQRDNINNLFKLTDNLNADASSFLLDARKAIDESILVRKNRKHQTDLFFIEIEKRADNFEMAKDGFKIIEDNFNNIKKLLPKINTEINNLKLVVKRMQDEIHPFAIILV